MHTETIGTGETYTTIQGWENGRNGELSEIEKGQCKAESFAENVTIAGSTTAADKYMHLTSVVDSEHDGRAHEVSDAGNSRIEDTSSNHLINVQDEYFRISWMELKGPGNNNELAIYYTGVGAGIQYVHHCIIHNNHACSWGGIGVFLQDTSTPYAIYRNIVYGWYSCGIRGAYGDVDAYNNTVYECNSGDTAGTAGLELSTAGTIVAKNNGAFDNLQADLEFNGGTLDNNASSDSTGDNDLDDLTTGDQFVNATTTWANTDLCLKSAADLVDAGSDLSGTGYEEIDESIDNRGVSISGTWDVGACEYVSAGGAIAPTAALYGPLVGPLGGPI